MVQNAPCLRASSLLFPHWDIKTKRPEPVKLDLLLFLLSSAGIIMSPPSSKADFVPCDRLLQKAYYITIIITQSSDRANPVLIGCSLVIAHAGYEVYLKH